MSEVKVNKISPRSGTDVTLGDSGDTFTIPSGATILNSGTASGFGDNLEWQSSIVTASTITVTANKGYWIDTTSNACTITLPAAAAVGDRLIFTDYARNWATNAVTINPNSLNFQGNTTPQPVYDTNGESIDIVYSGATQGWIPNTDGAVALETPQIYNADFLVVAGGGGSGSSRSGGGSGAGGAGGYRTGSSVSLTKAQVYTITVGAGGALGAGTSGANQGGDGGPSSISGSGITTITSAGGGGGGAGLGGSGAIGRDGGSGGGGGANAGPSGLPFAGGSGNVPSTSPVQGYDGGTTTNASGYGSGGGGSGGAAPAGGSSPSSAGPGTSNSITGSSVTYAAGGIAGNNQPGDAGGANTGNGAQGSGQTYAGNTGGSGVVILSVPDADYTGTTTGSPTVATGVSGKTVMTFTGDGSYTA